MSDITLPAAQPSPWFVTGWLLAAIGAGSAANAVLALLARAANAPADFRPLQPSSYVLFTALGVVVGALGWAAVLRLSKNPQALLNGSFHLSSRSRSFRTFSCLTRAG